MATPTINTPVSVFCADTQMFVLIAPGQEFGDDDPVVTEFAWAFAGAGVEDASANPGSKRTVRRTSAKPS